VERGADRHRRRGVTRRLAIREREREMGWGSLEEFENGERERAI